MNFQLLKQGWRTAIRLGMLVLVTSLMAHCAHKEANPDDPDALFNEAEEAFKDEKFLIAIDKYRDIKNRFPYSTRATDAELRIADAYFDQESYIEAESAYEIFKELHPTHPKAAYVQYRIALSFYDQIPSNSARDLTAAHKAIESFNVVIDKYPSSEFVAKAKEYIQESRKKLAEHQNYVADFYFQRQHYLSASYRYSALLQEFSNLGYDEEALFRLGKSYFNVRMFSNAKDALRRFVTQFPSSQFTAEAQSLLDDINTTKKD